MKGSRLEVTLEYTSLKHIEISSRTDEKEFMEKYNMNEPVNEGQWIPIQACLTLVCKA